ncbi:MAG TPA: hypothetical protein VLX44_02025 [Xanthobacteraceae bacterium]|nr:hypothetical protein [Xanthobacteraceae bacterium]
MTAAYAIAQIPGRPDQQALVRRRQRAEARLVRERKRNSRLAFVGFAGLAAALTFGIHTTLAPAAGTMQAAPIDPTNIEFAKTRVAHVLLTTVESAYCRELRFSNENGRFSDGGRYRCFIDNEPTFHPGGPAPVRDAEVRADRISSFFRAR